MKPRYRLSRDAVELIERFEGFRQRAARLDNGGWTIGFGHTRTAREGAVVSREDAEALLLYDLIGVSHAVNEKVFTPLTQNQFDALTAFAFSIGVENFETSAVLRRVNEGQMLAAAYAMEMWRRAPVGGEMIVVDALVRRRAAEKALFLTPQDGLVPSPSPVLPPNLDYELLTAAPRETPVVVETSLEGDHASAERVEPVAAPSPPPTATEHAAVALGAQLEGLLAQDQAPDIDAQNAAPETNVEAGPPVESEDSPAEDLGFAFDQAPTASVEAESSTEELAPADLTEPSEAEEENFGAAEDEPVVSAPSTPQDPTVVDNGLPSGWTLHPDSVQDPFLLPPPGESRPAEAAPEDPAPEQPDEPELDLSRSVAADDRLAADLRTFRPEEAADFRLASGDWASASMLLLGLLLFGGGMVWAVMRTSTSGALINSTTVGWGVGLIGLALACTGFYRLLQRFQDGGDEPLN